MSINKIVREKRKELGLTQEQIAEYLGVSTPAVNKWEKGATYPDISLLPALARLLKTDLNTLLCFNEGLSQKEIGFFLNKVIEVIRKDSFEQGFAMAMEKVREYPACAELLHSVAIMLQGALMMSELSPEQKKPYDAQITALYERVAKCDDPKFTDKANYMLASRSIAGEEYGKAQKLLDLLPEQSALDKRTLQATLWIKEGKLTEAAKILERKLLMNIQETQITLVSLANISVQEGDNQNALRLATCAKKESELFDLWRYNAFIVPMEVAVSQKDIESSISTLKAMLAALLIPWDMKKSPICKHIVQKTNQENLGAQVLPPLLTELENSPNYDFLRSVPEFQQLIEQYRSKC